MTEGEQEKQGTEQAEEAGQGGGGGEDSGPDAAELDKDPAYNPPDKGLKDVKGG
jgi:hypothetical protein